MKYAIKLAPGGPFIEPAGGMHIVAVFVLAVPCLTPWHACCLHHSVMDRGSFVEANEYPFPPQPRLQQTTKPSRPRIQLIGTLECMRLLLAWLLIHCPFRGMPEFMDAWTYCAAVWLLFRTQETNGQLSSLNIPS